MNASKLKRPLGEFVIIVLGVLVALVADRTMTKQLEDRAVGSYLDDLVADLVADSAGRQRLFGASNARLRSINALLDDLNGVQPAVSPAATLRNLWLAQVPPDPVFHRTTLRDLISTGNMRLLSQELRRRMFEYDAQIENLMGNISSFGESHPRFGDVVPGHVRNRLNTECGNGGGRECRLRVAQDALTRMSAPELNVLQGWSGFPGIREELQRASSSYYLVLVNLDTSEALHRSTLEMIRAARVPSR